MAPMRQTDWLPKPKDCCLSVSNKNNSCINKIRRILGEENAIEGLVLVLRLNVTSFCLPDLHLNDTSCNSSLLFLLLLPAKTLASSLKIDSHQSTKWKMLKYLENKYLHSSEEFLNLYNSKHAAFCTDDWSKSKRDYCTHL